MFQASALLNSSAKTGDAGITATGGFQAVDLNGFRNQDYDGNATTF